MEEPRPFITPPKADYRAENEFMQLAIDEARAGIYNGEGGPFAKELPGFQFFSMNLW